VATDTAAGDAQPILVYGDDRLRRVCRPVTSFDQSTARLADRLWASLLAGDGVGLAAPQIGDGQRLFVVKDPRRKGMRRRLVVINPTIAETFGDRAPFEEGCLSFPGVYLRIWRRRGVRLRYRDLDGAECRLEDEGLVARIVQHELDHLDGVLFLDGLRWWQRRQVGLRMWWLRKHSPAENKHSRKGER